MFYELYKILEKPHASRYGVFVQRVILLNILLNISVSFISDFLHIKDNVISILHYIEYFTVFLFCMELFSRYLVIGHDKKYKGFLGKVKFTFTPFILIDIISLVPYFLTSINADVLLARVIRFLKYFRALKLIRLKTIIKNFLNINSFASSSILIQFAVLFVLSIFFIFIFSYAYDDKTSMMIFLDPPALAEAKGSMQMFLGVIELILGLLIGGTLISIITELLTNISNDIKNGYYPYKDKGHIVIINNNDKLDYILEEINYYYDSLEEVNDIVIFLPFIEDIEEYSQNLSKYSNIKIVLIKGDLFNWNSYEKLNINHAKKVLILKDKDNSKLFFNIKLSKFILSHEKFTNKKADFIIETENNSDVKPIYKEVFSHVKNKYSIMNHNDTIQSFLNRSIIEPDYFRVYSSFLSFKDFEFYTLKAKYLFKEKTSFKEASLAFKKGILIGIKRDEKILLNPNKNTIINNEDKLITIMEDKFNYYIKKEEVKTKAFLNIKEPKIKTYRKICILGDYDDINIDKISDFLEEKSIKNLKKIVKESEKEYKNKALWDEIVSQDYDMVILNLEDDFEFILTMYLRSIYKENKKFLDSIVNIIHDPVNSKILIDKNMKNNIILSEKIVGEYISQSIFNSNISQIFDEITQVEGSEFYLLNKNEYENLFTLSIDELKAQLLENNMIYIGVMKNNEFTVNHNKLDNIDKLVVLAKGRSSF